MVLRNERRKVDCGTSNGFIMQWVLLLPGVAPCHAKDRTLVLSLIVYVHSRGKSKMLGKTVVTNVMLCTK